MLTNKRKGFTLIELLAVLVVLAILALIAIPIVIKVINNAREDSYKRSIESYARAVEMGYARWCMQHPGEVFEGTLSDLDIDIKGDQVTCDPNSVFNDKGEVTLTGCQTEKSKKSDATLVFSYKDGMVKSAKVSYEQYSAGSAITFNGDKYYVVTDSSNSLPYVTALKATPLTVDQVNQFSNGYVNPYSSDA